MFSVSRTAVQRFANVARGEVNLPSMPHALAYCANIPLALDRHDGNTGWGLAQLISTRDFGAPKRYKGKGKYVRKKNAFRKKGEIRNVRELPPAPPVLNAVPKEELARQNAILDQDFAQEMKSRIDAQTESVRFGFEGVLMSDRVRRLFELSNGSQREVVKSQKHKGMELFQLREGDTGSSGVQSKFLVPASFKYSYCIYLQQKELALTHESLFLTFNESYCVDDPHTTTANPYDNPSKGQLNKAWTPSAVRTSPKAPRLLRAHEFCFISQCG
jgi:hypothetical protein